MRKHLIKDYFSLISNRDIACFELLTTIRTAAEGLNTISITIRRLQIIIIDMSVF